MNQKPQPSRMARLGVGKLYWFSILIFSGFGTLSFFVEPTPGDSFDMRLLGALFLALSALGVLWPILRLREEEKLLFTRHRSRDYHHEGILVRASPTNQLVIALGSLVFTALGLTIALAADSASDRLMGWLCVPVSLGLFLVFVSTILRNKPGLLLTAEGVVWNAYFHSPAFIEWDNIQRAVLFQKKEQYGFSDAFGLVVRDPSQIRGMPRAIRSAQQHYKANGFHFIHMAESLLYPLIDLQTLITYYTAHPELRPELSTGATLDKLPKILSSTTPGQQ